MRSAGRIRGPCTAPGPPAPTLPRIRLLLPPLHQFYTSDSAAGQTHTGLPPLSAAPFQNGSSLPRQPAASVLLGAHAGQLRLVLSAHARRPSPAVWPDIPLHLTCCERLAEPALTSWLRPSPNVSVRKLVRLRRREARVLGAWSGVHGLFSLFLGGVVFEWRPSRCPPARLRDASRGCADPCGSL